MIEIMRDYSIVSSEAAGGAAAGAFAIDRPRQLRALASPMRQEVIDALVAAGPLSVAELAAHLGRAADSLYFHLRVLKRVGLVLEVDRRRNSRHVAAVYDVPGRPMRIVQEGAPARSMDAVVSSVLRLAQRDYRRGLKDQAARVEGQTRNLWGGRVKGWVADEDLPRINALIEELQGIIRRGRPGPERRGIALAFVLAPVGKTKSTRSRGKRPQEGTGS